MAGNWVTLKSLCIHEASHAIVIEALGGKVTSILIKNNGDDGGMCYGIYPVDPILQTLISMAGWGGQVVLDRCTASFENSYSSVGDRKKLQKYKVTDIGTKLLRNHVLSLIKQNKVIISKLAKYLETHHNVKRKEFLKFLKSNS